ncbi:hypothetical protein II906_09845 [bacterium]|nr:hypothetical protein [bacterium]
MKKIFVWILTLFLLCNFAFINKAFADTNNIENKYKKTSLKRILKDIAKNEDEIKVEYMEIMRAGFNFGCKLKSIYKLNDKNDATLSLTEFCDSPYHSYLFLFDIYSTFIIETIITDTKSIDKKIFSALEEYSKMPQEYIKTYYMPRDNILIIRFSNKKELYLHKRGTYRPLKKLTFDLYYSLDKNTTNFKNYIIDTY